MTIRVNFDSKLTTVETFTGDYVSPGDATMTTSGLNESDSFTASTSVPVTKYAAFQQAMTAGTATINLAALPGVTAEEVVNLTGLKVQILKLRSLATNGNKITVAKGGSSGYGLCASGDTWSIVLSPGQSVLFFLDEAAPDVAGGARTIDLTGTLAQVLEVHVVAG